MPCVPLRTSGFGRSRTRRTGAMNVSPQCVWQTIRCRSWLDRHRIWFATGSQLDARNHPLLQDVLAAHPLEIVNGLPVVDKYLRWQGCELFIMGGLAALRVGPAARNLSGARAASDFPKGRLRQRIVPALTKSSIRIN